MGRRDRDKRPPVEPWGVDPPAPGEVQRVEVGPGGRGSRRTGLLVAVVAVLVLGVGLVVDSGDDDAPESAADGGEEDEDDTTSSTRRRRTTTTTVPTTTTTWPAGPVFGEPVGAGLLSVSQRGSATWIDLDTGERREVEVGRNDPYEIVAVRGGVVAGQGATVWYQPLPEGEAVQLGNRFATILSSGSPDSVWLIEPGGAPDDADSSETSVVTLVDLEGRHLRGPFEIATPMYGLYHATTEGVLYGQGGRTFLAVPSGSRAVAVGDPLYTDGTSVAVYTCDEQARCGVELVDLATGASTRVSDDADPRNFYFGASIVPSPDGEHLAVMNWSGDVQTSLEVRNRAGTVLWTAKGRLDGQLRWLPGDLGLLIGGGSEIRRIYRSADGVGIIEPVPALDGLIGDSIHVVIR